MLNTVWAIKWDRENVLVVADHPPYENHPPYEILGNGGWAVHGFKRFVIVTARSNPEFVYAISVRWWAIVTIPLILPAIVGVRRYLWGTNPAGQCPKCGYDLRATPDRCPECGSVPAEKIKISN